MYNEHLSRISNRPGENFQIYYHRKLLEKFLKKVKIDQKSRILEIGSGSGRMAIEIISKGYGYSAIEPTVNMRISTENKIAETFPNQSSEKIYSEPLPVINSNLIGKFEIALMIHVLEHAGNPIDAHNWLTAINQTLKPNGYIFLLSPDYRDYKMQFYDADWTHSYPTTLNRTVAILEDCGFEIIYAKGIRFLFTNTFVKFLLFFCKILFPTALVNYSIFKLSNHKLLGTGIASSMLLNNIFIIGQKKAEKTKSRLETPEHSDN